MPIAKTAVEAYLNRKVESKAWFKSLTAEQVEEDLAAINPKPKFTIPTFRLDQKICFLMGVAYPEILIMLDLGSGKTGISLELLSYFYHNKFIRRGFVFTPTNEVAEGWEDEIKKWGFTIPYIRLTQHSSKAKWEALSEFGDGLVIGTFIGLASMASKFVQIRNKANRKRKPDKSLVENLFNGADAVVYDQSTKIANKDTLSFKVCDKLSERASIRYGLAGRAFGRDPFPLWGQLYLLDRGKALGRNSWMYREAFWRPEQHKWGTNWVLRKRREPLLAEFLSASSIRYSIDECVQLPPKVSITKHCEFPEENWRYYDEIKAELIGSKGNYREVKNAFLRLRQISSGFVGFIDDETGDKAQIEFQHNPKIDLLIQLLEEVPEDKKIVIFHEFNWSGSRICQELTKHGYKYGWLWGGTKNWTEIKDRFNGDPEFRIILANWKKASMGLNLQTASYEFMFESPVSAIDRYECEGRIYRTGQKHTSFVYDLIMRDSVDGNILDFHKEGKDLWKSLVENPQKILKKGR